MAGMQRICRIPAQVVWSGSGHRLAEVGAGSTPSGRAVLAEEIALGAVSAAVPGAGGEGAIAVVSPGAGMNLITDVLILLGDGAGAVVALQM